MYPDAYKELWDVYRGIESPTTETETPSTPVAQSTETTQSGKGKTLLKSAIGLGASIGLLCSFVVPCLIPVVSG